MHGFPNKLFRRWPLHFSRAQYRAESSSLRPTQMERPTTKPLDRKLLSVGHADFGFGGNKRSCGREPLRTGSKRQTKNILDNSTEPQISNSGKEKATNLRQMKRPANLAKSFGHREPTRRAFGFVSRLLTPLNQPGTDSRVSRRSGRRDWSVFKTTRKRKLSRIRRLGPRESSVELRIHN